MTIRLHGLWASFLLIGVLLLILPTAIQPSNGGKLRYLQVPFPEALAQHLIRNGDPPAFHSKQGRSILRPDTLPRRSRASLANLREVVSTPGKEIKVEEALEFPIPTTHVKDEEEEGEPSDLDIHSLFGHPDAKETETVEEFEMNTKTPSDNKGESDQKINMKGSFPSFGLQYGRGLCSYYALQGLSPEFCRGALALHPTDVSDLAQENRQDDQAESQNDINMKLCEYFILRGYLPFFCRKQMSNMMEEIAQEELNNLNDKEIPGLVRRKLNLIRLGRNGTLNNANANNPLLEAFLTSVTKGAGGSLSNGQGSLSNVGSANDNAKPNLGAGVNQGSLSNQEKPNLSGNLSNFNEDKPNLAGSFSSSDNKPDLGGSLSNAQISNGGGSLTNTRPNQRPNRRPNRPNGQQNFLQAISQQGQYFGTPASNPTISNFPSFNQPQAHGIGSHQPSFSGSPGFPNQFQNSPIPVGGTIQNYPTQFGQASFPGSGNFQGFPQQFGHNPVPITGSFQNFPQHFGSTSATPVPVGGSIQNFVSPSGSSFSNRPGSFQTFQSNPYQGGVYTIGPSGSVSGGFVTPGQSFNSPNSGAYLPQTFGTFHSGPIYARSLGQISAFGDESFNGVDLASNRQEESETIKNVVGVALAAGALSALAQQQQQQQYFHQQQGYYQPGFGGPNNFATHPPTPTYGQNYYPGQVVGVGVRYPNYQGNTFTTTTTNYPQSSFGSYPNYGQPTSGYYQPAISPTTPFFSSSSTPYFINRAAFRTNEDSAEQIGPEVNTLGPRPSGIHSGFMYFAPNIGGLNDEPSQLSTPHYAYQTPCNCPWSPVVVSQLQHLPTVLLLPQPFYYPYYYPNLVQVPAKPAKPEREERLSEYGLFANGLSRAKRDSEDALVPDLEEREEVTNSTQNIEGIVSKNAEELLEEGIVIIEAIESAQSDDNTTEALEISSKPPILDYHSYEEEEAAEEEETKEVFEPKNDLDVVFAEVDQETPVDSDEKEQTSHDLPAPTVTNVIAIGSQST
ncbi:uncharacterized protein LOC131881219 isoform X1 [Tigriopus californicus]|uniref:uncharacterized protein LOC131881219 isoform X1 n=1 Tax=Tigriopus californicus TaxID=6832 RepID=UPI0027D9D11F|nr:uncharacterized protein LOC131881219 isoform X1 [Tigriopus californicus]